MAKRPESGQMIRITENGLIGRKPALGAALRDITIWRPGGR